MSRVIPTEPAVIGAETENVGEEPADLQLPFLPSPAAKQVPPVSSRRLRGRASQTPHWLGRGINPLVTPLEHVQVSPLILGTTSP